MCLHPHPSVSISDTSHFHLFTFSPFHLSSDNAVYTIRPGQRCTTNNHAPVRSGRFLCRTGWLLRQSPPAPRSFLCTPRQTTSLYGGSKLFTFHSSLFTSNPEALTSSQNLGYDLLTTCGLLIPRPGRFRAKGANASAIRWSS